MINSKGKSKMSESFQRQSRKNFEFCSHKNCTLTQMLGEWRESQSTPVQEKKDKGKGKAREVDFSDIEELDGPPSSKDSEPKPR